ncbi:MAG: type II toxin-antitoxin system YoeB family toxin [Bacteroidales bacterium]
MSELGANFKKLEQGEEIFVKVEKNTIKMSLVSDYKQSKDEYYSKRITLEHRLLYTVSEDIKTVNVLKARGHY